MKKIFSDEVIFFSIQWSIFRHQIRAETSNQTWTCKKIRYQTGFLEVDDIIMERIKWIRIIFMTEGCNLIILTKEATRFFFHIRTNYIRT